MQSINRFFLDHEDPGLKKSKQMTYCFVDVV